MMTIPEIRNNVGLNNIFKELKNEKADYSCCVGFMAFAAMNRSASAQTWITVNGNIKNIDLSYDTDFAFRVEIFDNGADQLKNCARSFAYINNTLGENYQATVASLMTAYTLSKRVSLNYIKEDSGFCRITDFSY